MSNNDLNLFERFVRLEILLHRYHQHNHRHNGPMSDPHRGQGRILALLKLKPEISQKELYNILDIRSQSLGELLIKLERSGYITRTPSETDRRVMDIHLTEAGRAASEQNEQELDTETLFECLNKEEQTALTDYLDRIIVQLEQQFGGVEQEHHHGHPHFGGKGFDKHFDMEGRQGHCDDKDFDCHASMKDRRPHFHGRGFVNHFDMDGDHHHFHIKNFSQHPNDEKKPEEGNTFEDGKKTEGSNEE